MWQFFTPTIIVNLIIKWTNPFFDSCICCEISGDTILLFTSEQKQNSFSWYFQAFTLNECVCLFLLLSPPLLHSGSSVFFLFLLALSPISHAVVLLWFCCSGLCFFFFVLCGLSLNFLSGWIIFRFEVTVISVSRCLILLFLSGH